MIDLPVQLILAVLERDVREEGQRVPPSPELRASETVPVVHGVGTRVRVQLVEGHASASPPPPGDADALLPLPDNEDAPLLLADGEEMRCGHNRVHVYPHRCPRGKYSLLYHTRIDGESGLVTASEAGFLLSENAGLVLHVG